MAFTYTASTTFAENIDREVGEFNLTTTTGLTVGMILVTPGEIMRVRAIPTAGRVSVRRGHEGTFAGPHDSGETVWFGAASDYAQIKDNAMRTFGMSKFPDICIPGARGTDVRGYEYILVDCTATMVPGATVLISKDGNFTASVLTQAGQGNVGILVEDGTSNQWAWAMIRGITRAKLGGGSSLMTSTGVLVAATSVSTPAVGLVGLTTSQAASSLGPGATSAFIYGMWPTSATSTASTSATSETGYFTTVWMEYPFVIRRLTS
jgi:hypothetical protein